MAKIYFIIFLFFLYSCQKSDMSVAVYDSAKQQSLPKETIKSSPSSKLFKWNTPKNWEEKPGNDIRIGNFVLTGKKNQKAEISVITLSGSAGGLIANINRWRKQIELPQQDQEQITKELKDIEGKLGKYNFIKMENKVNHSSILAAFIQLEGQTLFVKAKGPTKIISKNNEAFIQFVRGIHAQ